MTKTLPLILLPLFLAHSALAAWNPKGWEVGGTPNSSYAISTPSAVAEGALWVYRNLFSPVDGDRCPSYPTCSAYASKAVKSYGALKGTIMTSARLLGEADEAAFAPKIMVGELKVYAPPERDMKHLWGDK